MSEAVLKSAVPILFVRDVPASATFFREKLGFAIDFLHGEPPFYGSVSRDKACIHLRFVHLNRRSRAALPARIGFWGIPAFAGMTVGRFLSNHLSPSPRRKSGSIE